MAIPDYQSIMLPLLSIAGDKQEHEISEIVAKLSDEYHLTDDERNQRLPSGRMARFYNRVHWAKAYLKNAGLLDNIARGRFRITEQGLDVLKKKPNGINAKFLEQFPKFLEFKHRSRLAPVKKDEVEDESQTPEELLESGYQNLRTALSQELLERIKKAPPGFFEQLVVDLLVTMGYGGSRKDAGEAVGKSGDGGIDGIIKEDKLGLDAVYIQAKRWDAPVGRPIVQSFVGSLEGFRATKGVLITTSKFAQSAEEYVKTIGKRIILIDGDQLAQLMFDFDVGVADVAAYKVKKVDLDYFGED